MPESICDSLKNLSLFRDKPLAYKIEQIEQIEISKKCKNRQNKTQKCTVIIIRIYLEPNLIKKYSNIIQSSISGDFRMFHVCWYRIWKIKRGIKEKRCLELF